MWPSYAVSPDNGTTWGGWTDADGTVYTFRWACNLTYRTHTLHAILCDAYQPETGKTNRFMYLTDIRPDASIIKNLGYPFD